MIRLSAVWSLATAEMRTIRRLVRYWLFAALATGITVLFFGYYAVLHGLFSSYSGSVGSISPKFLLSQTAMWQTIVFAVALIFLAFDVRARDTRERIVEVLDTRPFSNLELVFGRFLGTLIPAWIPLLLTMLFIQGLGILATTFDWFVGEPVVWKSVFQYLLIESIPAFSLYIAFVYFVSLVTRNRLISAITGLALIGVLLWLNFILPLYMVPAIGVNGGFIGNASEMAPQLFGADGLLLRGAILVIAFGLLLLSAAVHPRLDGGRKRLWAGAGAALMTVGVGVIGLSIVQARGALERLDRVREVHASRLGEPLTDIKTLRGDVTVGKGRQLDLDLELLISAATEPIESTLFTLNPGLKIESVRDVGGSDLTFTHEDGLLDIELPAGLSSGEEQTLRLVAHGRPDVGFAYLDSAINWLRKTWQDGQLILLGTEAGFFEKRMVVLTPGIAWLPKAGPAVALDDPRQLPIDFFDLDLEVSAPEDWTIVGPGKTADGGTVRLRPRVAVPEVAVVAGRFERRAIEIEGVRVEALMSPGHKRNLDFFADAAEEIENRVAGILSDAREMGLSYPYETLSLVEVPWSLRSYAGGWRMDTIHAPPAMLLLSESGFPTSRFEFQFRNPDRFEEREGGIGRSKLNAIETYFENDFNGGNIFDGASRNFFIHQTAASGPEALALDALCRNLVNRLITDKDAYFSAHVFDADMGWMIGEVMQNLVIGGGTETIAKSLIRSATDRPEVWDGVLSESLTEMDPWKDPKRSVNVLFLKANAIADAIIEGAGREKTAKLLSVILRDHRGSNFDADDFLAAATEAEIDVESLVGDFLHETDLPGFMVSPVEVARLADDEQGLPRYQTRLFVRNAEPVPGLVRLRYFVGSEDDSVIWENSDAVRIAGETSMELGLVTSKPPRSMFVSPYLALNRRDFAVALPEVDEEMIADDEPLRGARPADWLPRSAGQIVVDDLDSTFSVTEQEKKGGFRLAGGLSGMFTPETVLDQGLPAFRFGPPPKEWSRYEGDSNWGRYRRTMAIVEKGDGSRTANFRTELPSSGRWRIELHLPLAPGKVTRTAGASEQRQVRVQASVNQGWRFGTYDLRLLSDGSDQPIEFDAGAAGAGWSSLGDFNLAAGSVEVILSDETSGTIVVADALRFVQVGGAAAGGSP